MGFWGLEEIKETRKNPKKRAFNELANDDW
jgi:hypothetical protein